MRLKKRLRNLTLRVKRVLCPVCAGQVSTRQIVQGTDWITFRCAKCLTHVHCKPNKDLAVIGHTDALSVAMRNK